MRRMAATALVTLALSTSTTVALTSVTTTVSFADAGDVTTMTGPGSALDGMYLTYVGCEALDADAAPPTTRINLGPQQAPLGRRSFGLVPGGAGSASGPTISFLSLGALHAGLDVRAEAGTSGASYLGVATADTPLGYLWRGRAALVVAPASWQHVDNAALTYQWQQVKVSTGQVVASESSTPADFVARHGDGPGYLVTGFGCDAHAFNLDAVRGNGRTWDFEGLSLTTTMTASTTQIGVGQEVTFAGTVSDPLGRVTGDPLILQARAPGQGEWTDVSPLTYTEPDGASRTRVTATRTQEYRWLRPQSEYADEGATDPVLVTVTQ